MEMAVNKKKLKNLYLELWVLAGEVFSDPTVSFV